jgi:DNA-binding transcriptional regulator GbsR (MarR family)
MSKSKAPSPVEKELIEEFGNIYESYGLRRLQGLIVGLLLTKSEPVSLDDMVEILDRSKGPISISVRRLDDMDLVRKVEGPNNRRNYYASHPDIFFNNFKSDMATVRENRSLAKRFLARIEAEGKGTEKTRESLKHMEVFYDLLESFFEAFAERWPQIKQKHLEGDWAGDVESNSDEPLVPEL